MQEMNPPRKLAFTGVTFDSFRVVGMIYLGTTSYFVRDWRNLQLILAIPTLITLMWSWLIPESPKWLLAKDRNEETLKQIDIIAKRNNDKSFMEERNKMQLTLLNAMHQNDTEMGGNGGGGKVIKAGKVIDLFTNSILRKHVLIMMIVWFSANWSYFGFLLFIPSLPGGEIYSPNVTPKC